MIEFILQMLNKNINAAAGKGYKGKNGSNINGDVFGQDKITG